MNAKFTKLKKHRLLFALLIVVTAFSGSLKAQLVGTKNVPGDYATLALAVADLNTQGVGAGGVTINLIGGNPQTAPVGGYTINATGTAADQIIITGNNNTITAATPQASGSKVDAIFKIVGGDYITIQGFTLLENAANTTTAVATNNMTEFGIAIFAGSATNGAQYNTVQNNTITLNNATVKSPNTIGIFSSSASSSTGAAQNATSSAGTNSYNKFYGNNISGANAGMYFSTVAQTTSIIESGIDIGGNSPATGNTISYGIANAASTFGFNLFNDSWPAAIFIRNGADFNIKYNTLSTHPVYVLTSGVLFINYSTNPAAGVTTTVNVSNNNVTLNHNGTSSATAIDFGGGNGTTAHIANNNTVTVNLNHSVATSGTFWGIRSSYSSGPKSFNSNVINFIQSTTGTGVTNTGLTGIDGSGTSPDIQILANSVVFNQTTSSTAGVTGNITGLKANVTATNVTIGAPASGNTVTIQQAKTGSGLYGAGSVTYINAGANHSTLNVTDNTINNTGSSQLSTGTSYGIFHTGTIGSSLNISDNLVNIEGGISTGPATLYGIFGGGSSTITNYLILNNVVTLNAIAGSQVSGIYNGDGTATTNKRISLNNITITGNATVVRGIYNNAGKGFISNNILNLNSASATPTSMTGVEIASAAVYANEVRNNTITTLNLSGLITSNPTISGVLVSAGNGGKVYSSNINNITVGAAGSTGAASAIGININGGTLLDIYKNKIYNITNNCTGGSVFAIASSGGTTNNIYNNLIGDLNTPNTNSGNGVVGINMSGGTTLNVHYNSVYLNATSTGTLFGSSAISTNGTPTTINLRNNIFVNNSTPTGTAIAVAFRRNLTSLTNYGGASNNNLYYASTPSASTAIFYDGTTVYQDLASFKTLVGPSRDAGSVTENPNFASTVSSNANFLHFNPSTNSAAESGAISISGATDDFDSDIRQGNAGYAGTGSAPDIGADEFDGVTSNLVINGIAITPTGNLCTAVSRNVTATVTPGAAPITSVTLNYSLNGVSQTPITMTGGSFTTTSTWIATIPTAVPANASVTWSVSATDGTLTKSVAGASYIDEPTFPYTMTAAVNPNPVCAGNVATFSLNLSGATNTNTYCIPAATSSTLSYFNSFTTTGGITNITNSGSGFSPGNYGNFTNLTVSQKIGQTVNFNTALQGTTVGVAIWVDWNQNGVFEASERVYNTTGYVSSSSGSFAVPATATPGKTRMRILMDYTASNPGNPCAFSGTRGEIEDYSFLVLPSSLSYEWTDGVTTFTSATSPSTMTINTTATYTGSVYIDGCPISSSVLVNATPIPSAPSATNSSQCGLDVPTASVSGASAYNWYATPTSTTVLQTGASTNFTSVIGATTTWYVTSLTGTCESPTRTALTQTVSIPDLVNANTSAANICVGGANTVSLSAVQSGTNGNVYTFSWDASPVTGSGMPSTMTGSMVTVTPTLPGTYVYTVTAADGVCTTVSSVSVTLNNLPSISAVSNPTQICSGSSVNLNAQSINGSVTTTAVGAGATTSATYPNPFYSLWSNTHNQYLIKASELSAANILAGNINSLAIDINSGTMTMQDFSIKIGHSTATTMSAFVSNAGFTTVFNAASVTPVVGLNTLNFSTPFNWDGVSNIVIEICHGNSGSSATMSSNAKVDNTSYVSTIHTHKSAASAGAITCGDLTTNLTTYSIRPKFVFNATVGTNVTNNMVWQWNPGSINSNTAIVNPVNTGTVASTDIYTATVTNTNTGCSNSTTVAVVVNPLPTTPVAFDNTQCGIGIPTATVSGGTNYHWYATPTSTTIIQSGSSANYTNSISSTTTWYVSSHDGTCESPRVALTQSVTIPDAVNASSSATTLCMGGANTITLTAASSGTTNAYVYTWTASPASGSGIPTSVSGASAAITPTLPGTYTYSVQALDGACATAATVTVTLNSLPGITTMATPTAICSGANVMLNAQSFYASAGTATVGSQSTTGSTGSPYHQTGGVDSKVQYLYNPSGLNGAGIYQGYITSLIFNATTAGSGQMDNFTIKLGATSATSLNATYNTSATSIVYGPYSYSVTLGQNVHTFDTPFYWDGVSNLVIEVCHDAVVPAGSLSSISLQSSTNRAVYSYAAGACGLVSGTNATNRPVIAFGAQVGTDVTSSTSFVWNPGAINSYTALVNPINTGTVAATQVYTATVTNTVTGCSNSATAGVLVNPIPSAPIAFDNIQCGVGVPTASVSGGTSYLWYASPTSTTVLQSGASANFTTSISSTTTWYVSSLSGAGCESSTRIALTQTVTTPDAVSASVSSASVCPNTSAILTAVSSGTTNNYSYTWTASPVGGSGIPTSVTGNTVSIIPSVAGSYIYTLTAFDGTCTAMTTTSLMVYQAITTPPTVAANPNPICSGNNSTLTAVFAGSTINPTYTLPPAVSNPTVDEDLGNVTFGPLNNTTTRNSLVGTIGTASGTAGSYSDFTSFGPFPVHLGTTYTLSLRSLQNTTAYNNRMAAYIDYNRNGVFTDPGEAVYVAGTSVSGAHTETATVTIPLTASLGNARMRVFVIETTSAITGPTQAISWGEYEEYTLNLVPSMTFAWTDGTSTIGSSNPLVVNPSNNTTYSFVGTDNHGCIINSTAVTVTVNLTPTVTAVSSSSTICSGNSATLTASGATNYTWSAAAGTASTSVVSPSVTSTYTVTGETLGCSSTATVDLAVTTTPTVNVIASASVMCSGPANTVTLTAVSSNSTYAWSPSGGTSANEVVSPGANTVYTVTSNNAGCTASATVAIGVNPTPTVNAAASTSAICSGVTATLTATGATNYTWAPTGDLTANSTVTPNSSTTYTVVGESLGCSSTATVDLIVTQTPTVSASAGPTAICLGNSATLTATSTTNDYSWSPAGGTSNIAIVAPSSNTTYTVTSTNGACVGTATVDLVIVKTPTVTISPSNAASCFGGNITLTANGADTYTWSSGGGNSAAAVFSPTTMTTYSVIGSNMCGSGTASTSVSVDFPVTLSASTSATMICLGLESATLTANSTATSFTWSPGGQITANVVVSPTVTTIYTVSTSNACGVVTATVTQNVQTCNGIEELSAAGMNVYPNPTTDVVNFEIPVSLVGKVKLEIYDALGKMVALEELTKEVTSLRVAKFDAGVYMFKMISNNGDVKIGRLIKQ